MKHKQIKKAIRIILKDIKKNGLIPKHGSFEFNPDCPACKFKILEGFLLWYEDLLDFGKKTK